MPFCFQRTLQLGRQRVRRRETEPGGERIAEHHDPHRAFGRRPPLTFRQKCRNTSSAMVTQPERWTGRPGFPYDRSGSAGPGGTKDRMNDTSMAHPPAIRLSGVNLSLGRDAARVHILKDIDLHIGTGEAVGLVGPSGSGKSTLLMVAAGLERPDTGAVFVAGEDLGRLDEDALARFRGRHVGIVFQSFHLIPTMTALENVAVPLELAGSDGRVRARRAGARRGRSARPGEPLSGRTLRRRAAARRARPRAGAASGDPRRRRADRQSRRERPAARSSSSCSPATRSAPPRWCW